MEEEKSFQEERFREIFNKWYDNTNWEKYDIRKEAEEKAREEAEEKAREEAEAKAREEAEAKAREEAEAKAEEKKVSKEVEEDLAKTYDYKDEKDPNNMIFGQIQMARLI